MPAATRARTLRRTRSTRTTSEPDKDGAETEEGEDELATWYQDAHQALLQDPDNELVLANFREARRALHQARTFGVSTQSTTQTFLAVMGDLTGRVAREAAKLLIIVTRSACDVGKRVILQKDVRSVQLQSKAEDGVRTTT